MGGENRKGGSEEPGAFQKVLDSLNQEQKIRALEIARKHGIPDGDPVWHVVLMVAEAEEVIKGVAQSLREASVEVTKASEAEVKRSRAAAVIEINKLQETVKKNVSEALGPTLTTEIGEAVKQLKRQTNRPLHKRWLIGAAVAIVVALGLGGWGTYVVHKDWVDEGWAQGFDSARAAANATAKDYQALLDCSKPGWTLRWSADNKKAFCIPGPDPKTGVIHGVQIFGQ